MNIEKFSLDDVVVLKDNDNFNNDEMARIVGGVNSAVRGCICKCGTNSASLTSSQDSTQN
ncbi:hypothetical protein [Proteiniphilum sp. X52]|uniref:hypothetical protein n=1 Tax=Proteiniphilum sp. X52 TaxID=2382159 RepID=UPI000F0A9434|nr:hypothetical protein [Proteiniphilum sp. X52]RNC63296.1 hypothetical protein D7D25_17285 [Proteiniphilum sp. X52]